MNRYHERKFLQPSFKGRIVLLSELDESVGGDERAFEFVGGGKVGKVFLVCRFVRQLGFEIQDTLDSVEFFESDKFHDVDRLSYRYRKIVHLLFESVTFYRIRTSAFHGIPSVLSFLLFLYDIK